MKSGIYILICLVFIIACCATDLRPVDKYLEETSLSFIEDGKTTKDEIILKYGFPMKTFNNGGILIYNTAFSEKRGFITMQDVAKVGDYHFVFVFDENNILKRHSFLKVR